MSRRPPNPAAERSAQNQATIKSLLKLEANKICADCKRNKHPRWASWNLGVFICIRCSGIHRGMGTHVSRVKSVDLDSWTDEQMQTVLSWGNARANKYWEAKLAAGHVPSESKIENFIRTKYELKRWAMDGPKPDPATLDAAAADDDDVPLSVVKQKQSMERSQSVRQAGRHDHLTDLIGGDDPVAVRTSMTTSSLPKSAQTVESPLPKTTTTTSTRDSLLGLDFLGGPSAPARPASTSGVSTRGQSRPDLKQSILSLYASAPRPNPQTQHGNQPSASPGTMTPPIGSQQQSSTGGLSDAFSTLSMPGTASGTASGAASRPASADPFASLRSASPKSRPGSRPPSQAPQHSSPIGNLSGGHFFEAKPPQHPAAPRPDLASTSVFDTFTSFTSPAPSQPTASQGPGSAMGDLFDLSAPVTNTPSPAPSSNAGLPNPASNHNSVFNLSSSKKPASPSPASPLPTAAGTSNAFAGMSGADVWGGNEWSATPEPTPLPAQNTAQGAKQPADEFGWGSSGSLANTPIVPSAGGGLTTAPKVAADEEFGDWGSGTDATTATAAPKTGGFGAEEDLFSNVWQ